MKTSKIKNTIVLISFMILIAISCCACQAEEDGPKKVVQKYFDALKIGDTEGAIECFIPPIQEQYKLSNTLGGMLSKALFGIDGSIFSGVFTSYATRDSYKNCTFIVDGVVFTDEKHEHANVHVTVEGASGWIPKEDTLETVKYSGEWYLDQ